jgi:hypothetical protein
MQFNIMRTMYRILYRILAVALLCAFSLSASGCLTHRHIVGNGASTGQSQTAKDWYLLWGLVRLNTVDTKAMAGNTSNYTIDTEESFLDGLIYYVTAGIVGARTVTVIK